MAHIKIFLIVAIVLFGLKKEADSKESDTVFRFVIPLAPHTFNPAEFYGTESGNFFRQLYRGLYKYDNEKGLVPEGAKDCVWKTPKELDCILNSDFKWSDGTPVTASDYVRAFRYLIDPNTKSREVTPLMKLKNAHKIIKGEVLPETLGISAVSDFNLKFEFEESDPEFIPKLIAPALIPWKIKPDIEHPEKLIVNGPYQIQKFEKGQKAILTKNPYYSLGNKQRPDVEVLFVDEDATAQNLFDFGRINFLMRIDASLIPQYKNKGLFNVLLTRFDYIGFGGDLENDKNFRKALSLSADFAQLKEVLSTAGTPGCAGLTKNYVNNEICHKFDLKRAKKALSKVSAQRLKKPIVFKFSKAGGDNIYRAMEWYQNQWKKNLGLDVELQPIEQGMYIQELKEKKPDLFRKGINLDRPTCLAALESFQKDSPDNYAKFSSPAYEKVLIRLANTTAPVEQKKLCEQGIQILMDDYRIIPQGLIQYTMIKDAKFDGISINELNQLDLSNLKATTR